MSRILPGVIAMAIVVVASNILVQHLLGDWLTWGALIVSLSLTGFLLWHSSQPLRIVADMPLETFQSEGQSYLVVPENATPLQCTTPSGRKAICLHMKNGD